MSGMVPLGFGTFVRPDRIVALVPLDPEHRGGGRRTYVHVEGIGQPLVASRSERAILDDVERASAATERPTAAPEPASDDGLRRLFGRQRRPARR